MTFPPAPLSPQPSSADRERVVNALSLHFAADHISLDELEEKLSVAYVAPSMDQLEGLTRGLPSLDNRDYAPGTIAMYAPSSVIPERGLMIAVFAGNARKGSWLVPRLLNVFALFGGAEIDLREARFAPGVTDIHVGAFFGGVEITVPPGVRVESNGTAIMGGFQAGGSADLLLDPSQPVLRLHGLAVFGGVEVKVRGPSKKMLARFEAMRSGAQYPDDG